MKKFYIFYLFGFFLGVYIQCSPRPIAIQPLLEKNPHPKYFRLNHKRIQDDLSIIGNYTELEELNLSFNGIEKIPDSIGNLNRLKKLVLYGNSIQDLPSSFQKLQSLQSLILGRNPITSVPNSLVGLPNLKVLSLDETKIKLTPSDIQVLASLKNLEILDLSENPNIVSIDESIEKLSHVKMIYFKKTSLSLEERHKLVKLLPHTRLEK